MRRPLLAAHLTGPNQGSNSQRTQIGDPNALTAILAILKKRKTQLGMANGMAGIDSRKESIRARGYDAGATSFEDPHD